MTGVLIREEYQTLVSLLILLVIPAFRRPRSCVPPRKDVDRLGQTPAMAVTDRAFLATRWVTSRRPDIGHEAVELFAQTGAFA
jgi:hypothetical protein